MAPVSILGRKSHGRRRKIMGVASTRLAPLPKKRRQSPYVIKWASADPTADVQYSATFLSLALLAHTEISAARRARIEGVPEVDLASAPVALVGTFHGRPPSLAL